MKWYRSNFDKTTKRTKYGFSNPVLPYIEAELHKCFNNSLEISGSVNYNQNDYYSYPSNDIKYNMFDEEFLIENIDYYSKLITYNIIANEVLINYDEDIKLFTIDESTNLFKYCSELISCLQYDRRISATISGIFY